MLSSASDPIEVLQAHLGGIGAVFAAAMADTSKFGMAKSLFGAVGPDVDLGDPSSKDTNNITLAGARGLIEVLDAADQMDRQIGDRAFKTRSSTELPTVDLAYRWARAGLVKVRKGRLTRTARGEATRNEDPADLVRPLTWTLVDKVGILAHRWRNAGPYAWDWHVQTVDAMIGEWLLMLYDVETADIDELAEEAWDQLGYEFDLSRLSTMVLDAQREGVGRDVLRSFRTLEGLGLVAVTDVRVEEKEYPTGYVDRGESGGTVTITPLDTWVMHDRASALGQSTVVGDLDLDAATLLERVLDGQSSAVLEVTDGQLDHGMGAVIGIQVDCVAGCGWSRTRVTP